MRASARRVGSRTPSLCKCLRPRPRCWRTIGRSFPIVSLLWLVAAGLVSAQDRRQGAWIDGALGYGSASFSCDTCTTSHRLDGWTFSFGAGGTLSPHFRLGGDLRLWMNGLKGRGAPLPGIGVVALSLSYFPRRIGGPFVVGGAGLSLYEVCKGRGDPIEPCANDTTYYGGGGWGETLGAGWDMGALRPFLAYHHGAVRQLRSPDHATVATGWNQNLLTIELKVFGNFTR